MHSTAVGVSTAFSQPSASLVPSVYHIDKDEIQGLPGMSGGALFVESTPGGNWLPVAIYLGGFRTTLVREIDGDVDLLIEAAALSSLDGDDHTGRGPKLGIPGDTIDSFPGEGSISVDLNISAGRWRIVDGSSDWLGSGEVVNNLEADSYAVEFEAVDGFDLPDEVQVSVSPGQLDSVDGVYKATSYQAWALAKFDASDANDLSIVGKLSDPDHDSIVNLLECAFETNPNSPDVFPDRRTSLDARPTISFEEQANGLRYLAVSYRRRESDHPLRLVYSVEFSSDCERWSGVGGETVEPAVDGWERVTVCDSVAMSAGDERFSRVRVTEQE